MSAYAPATISQQQLSQLWQRARELQNAGQLVEAAQAFQTLLRFAPANWATFYNLGLVYQGLQLPEQARDAYRRTIELNPGLAQAHNNLGSVLWLLEDSDGALAMYRRARELDPGLALAAFNAGLVEEALGQLTACVESMQRVVDIDPTNNHAWEKAFSLLIGLKRRDDAFELFFRWEAAAPMNLKRIAAGLMVSRLTGNRSCEGRYLAAIESWPFASYTPLDLVPILGNLQYYDLRAEVMLACYRRFDRAMSGQQKDRIALLPRRFGGKIRVGYVSPDFRQHVMGRIMLEVIRAHARDRFEIYLISTCDARFHDAMTAEFRAATDGFADISGLKDWQAAQIIGEVDLDILVDLAGHTMGGRPGVYAHRSARHIVTHLGYHGCIGMDTVEYKFTDRLADTEESAAFQIEKPFFLDTCLFPFSHVEPAAQRSSRDEQRRASGVEQSFVFATFVNPIKLSPRCLDTLKRVLDAIPGAKLAFSPYDKADEPLILGICGSANIDHTRVIFISADGDDAEQRARYRGVDAVLDTFPYAGGDTTLAALDMNIPVVTLKGARNSERTGYSILGHLGVTDTVAESEDEFVVLATRLAHDSEWYREVVAKIVDGKCNSPSADMGKYVAALEKAYVEIAAVESIPASTMSATEFHQRYKEALRTHQAVQSSEQRLAAATQYADLLKVQPEFAPLHYARGMLARDQLFLDVAEAHFAAAVASAPEDQTFRLALADALLARHEYTAAIGVIMPVATENSRNVRVHVVAARAYLGAGQWRNAATAADRAVRMTPTDIAGLFTLGVAQSHLSQAADALASFNRVLALDPKHAEAAYNAAILMGDHADLSTAERLLRSTIANAPENENAYWRLRSILKYQGRIVDVIALAQSFAKACHGSVRAKFAVAEAHRFRGNLEQESSAMRQLAKEVLAIGDDAQVEETLRALLHSAPGLDITIALLRQLTQRSDRATRAVFGAVPAEQPSSRTEKIRIGYLSDAFSASFTGRWLHALLRGHDQRKFSVRAYALNARRDDLTAQCEKAVGPIIATQGWTASRIADEMRSAGLDVLIVAADLDDERVASLIQQRPAGIVIDLPSNSDSVARAADLRLSDPYLELPAATDIYATVALTLDRCVYPMLENMVGAKSDLDRATLGIPQSAVVFAVAGGLETISLRGAATWKALLDRLPTAHLLFAPEFAGHEAAYQKILVTAGIANSRVTMLAPTNSRNADWSRRYDLADVVLDAIPANDVRAVLAAVAAAIPVITLAGQLPGERAGASILDSLGVMDTVVASGSEYVECAVRLATDPARRSQLGTRMKSLLPQSRLADLDGYMRAFEAALCDAVAHVGTAETTLSS